MPFPFPPRTFFIIFSNRRCSLSLPPSAVPPVIPRLQELAPSRKAGAKVEGFSFSARGNRKFFEKYFTCFYYAVPMIITQETDWIYSRKIFNILGFYDCKASFFGEFCEIIGKNKEDASSETAIKNE